ncbi:MAG: cytochrome P450 [Acidimicrobiia bacterium]|jgi:cytochrome P450
MDVASASIPELTALLLDGDFYAGDPHPVLARLRREAPVARDDRFGFWALTLHRDVHDVSRDNAVFVSGYGVNYAHFVPEPLPVPGSLLSCDPPTHTHYRRILWDAFTPKQIRALEPRIRARAVDLLDALDPGAVTEWVSAVSVPFPLVVLADLMGLPADDWREYSEWMDAAVRTNNPGASDADRAVVDRMRVFLLDAVAERAGTDAPGVITMVANHRNDDGTPLTSREQLMFLLQLFIAGNETTRNTITGGIVALAEHPGQWEALRADRSLLDPAIEEILRWSTAVTHFFRTARVDTEIGGVAIGAGDKVFMSYTSANRDEAVFGPTADRFDVARWPNPQIAFGFGAHFCLGAALARLEVRVLLEEMLDRFAGIEVAGPVERLANVAIAGFSRADMRVTERSRSA